VLQAVGMMEALEHRLWVERSARQQAEADVKVGGRMLIGLAHVPLQWIWTAARYRGKRKGNELQPFQSRGK